MAVSSNNHPLAMQLQKAMGLKNVRSITIRMAFNDVVTVTAEFEPSAEEFEPVFKRYELSARLLEEDVPSGTETPTPSPHPPVASP